MPKDTTAKTTARTRAAKAPAAKTARRAPRKRAAAPAPVTHEQIAARAYELHLAGSEGDAMAHWLRAERELATA